MRHGFSIGCLLFVFGCGQQTADPQASAPGGANPVAQVATPSEKPSSRGAVTRTEPASATSPGNIKPPTVAPASNMPISKAVPASVRVVGGPPTDASQPLRYQQREVTTSAKADGSCGWSIGTSSNDWGKSNLDTEFLKQHAVEAILSISEEEVKAWKVDGTPHPDFEGYIRLKLQSNERISFPMKFRKKTRIVVVKIPQRMQSGSSKTSLNVSLNTNDSGGGNLYELSNGDLGGNEYRFQYVVVSAPKEAKFASIPATINISASTEPVAIKVGQKFTAAGQSFEITAVRPFQKSDLAQGYGGYMGQQKLFTTVVVKSSGAARMGLQGSLINGSRTSYDPYSRITIDDKGNIVKEKVDPNRGFSGMMHSPMLQAMGGNASTGEIFLIANVNSKFVTSAVFMSSATIEATLENIPLEK